MQHTFIVVLGLTGLLVITSLLLPIARRINFPFTVLLAAVGCVFGIAAALLRNVEGLWILGDFIVAVESFSITSDAVFFIFLPALVFESALSIDVRKLIDDIVPILVLAVIGLLISTFIVGGALYVFAGVSFVVCLLLGAIVSATDPVAVVAIFKELGAPKRLAILVEGESLLNDATAIVMFTILMGMLTGGAEPTLLDGTIKFITVFIGGVVVGYLMARGLCWLIGRLRGVPLAEITLTVCLAYLSFVVAEHYLHVSGVMAVVTAALVVGSYGRTQISPETWHPLTETWEQLGFWANSLIFMLVGLLIPKIMSGLGLRELGLLLVLLVAAFSARAAILYGLLPLLGATGIAERVSLQYTTVMFWGGLRGAVSLALALAVLENPALSREVHLFIMVLVTAFVLFTLFINAPTMQALLAGLGLDKLSPADLNIRNRVLASSLADVRGKLKGVAEDFRIKPELAHSIARDYDERLAEIDAAKDRIEGLSVADRQRTGLITLINDERRLYLKQFNQGFVSSAVTRRLLGHTDTLHDGVKTGGVEGYDAAAERLLDFPRRFAIALRLQRHFGQTGLLASALADRFERLLVIGMVLRELLQHNRQNIAPLLGQSTCDELEVILNRRAAATEQQLDALRLQYPDYADTLQTRVLERVALRLEEADYKEMVEHAVISHEVFADLQSGLEARDDVLARRPRLDLGLEPVKLVGKVPFFTGLDETRIAEIAGLLKPRLVLPGELVVHKGDPGDAMYFISTGALEVDIEPEPVRLGSGDFFGEIALLKDLPRTADVTALSYCQVLALYTRDFRRLLDANPDLRERITKVAEERLGADA